MSGIRAEHFTVQRWLELVNDATAQLPEFQRDIVWKQDRTVKFLNAILQDRPVGCLLVLKIAPTGDAPFNPRPIEGSKPSSDKPIEYLILDGQQRVTALWNALMETSEGRTFFISYSSTDAPEVTSMARAKWHKDPKKCFDQGLIPISLLRYTRKPEDRQEVNAWVDNALADDEGRVVTAEQRNLEGWIADHSEQIRNFEIPHLAMPDHTTPSQAIDTFIQSNTSSLKLKKFDIATAESLVEKHPNLRESRRRAWEEISGLKNYIDLPTIGDLLLKVACLRSDLPPVESNYSKPIVLNDVAKNLDEIIEGIGWVVGLLRQDRIFDRRRLPTVVPFRVLPPLFSHLKGSSSAKQGKIRKTARAYLWRAFLTDRYKSAAANLLKEDFDGLQDVISHNSDLKAKVPIWKSRLPTINEIKRASWPTRPSLPKSLLAVSLRRGARDIGLGAELQESNLNTRQYHHIFAKAYLSREAPGVNPNLAMNCMLIDGRTNKEASDKPPLEYLTSLIGEEAGSSVSDHDLDVRLQSHLVPKNHLSVGKQSVAACYHNFVDQRARLLRHDIKELADGNDP